MIRLIVLMHVRFPLASRNVVELLFRRGIDICHDTVRTVKQGGPIFADGIGRQG